MKNVQDVTWIPVEEQLPQKSGWYLASCDTGDSVFVEKLHFDANKGLWNGLFDVYAWMDVPKAYKHDYYS